MKKALILIIAAVCFLQFNGYSQKTRVGLVGGITFSNMIGRMNNQDLHYDGRAGFTVGMILDAPIGKTGFTFQPGLHYMQKGTYTKKTSTVKEATALRYAQFDLNVVHYTKGAKNTRLFFGIGPYVGLNLPSKTLVITEDSKIETGISFGQEETSQLRGFDFGANGILGLHFKCGFIFSATYSYGIRNLLPAPETSDDKLKNSCISLRIGYLFNNNATDKK